MYLLIQDQVRITDQAPNQKREGEIWAWGGVGEAGPEVPPNVTEGAGQAPPLTGCLRPFHLSDRLARSSDLRECVRDKDVDPETTRRTGGRRATEAQKHGR